ncbi:hypothetical protein V8C44DRAFT_329366 [Trichoderma aethiopicum]
MLPLLATSYRYTPPLLHAQCYSLVHCLKPRLISARPESTPVPEAVRWARTEKKPSRSFHYQSPNAPASRSASYPACRRNRVAGFCSVVSAQVPVPVEGTAC